MSIRCVAINDKSVLNISFRKTSKGLVNTAPAIPADTDLIADRIMYQFRSFGSPRGNLASIISLTTTAVTYFGTVLSIPALTPWYKPATPRDL